MMNVLPNSKQVALSDTVPIGVQCGCFIPNLSGTLAVKSGGGHDVTMAVIGGTPYYGLSVVLFKATGTTTVTSVTVWY